MSDSTSNPSVKPPLTIGADPSHPLYFAQRRVDLDMLALVNGFERRLDSTMVSVGGISGSVRPPWYAPWADECANEFLDVTPWSWTLQMLSRLDSDDSAKGLILAALRISGMEVRVA